MRDYRLITVGMTLVILYFFAYGLLYQPNSVTFRVGYGEPLATYRFYSRWFDVGAFFFPAERLHYYLYPERHKHVADGLEQFVQMGLVRPRWWESRFAGQPGRVAPIVTPRLRQPRAAEDQGTP